MGLRGQGQRGPVAMPYWRLPDERDGRPGRGRRLGALAHWSRPNRPLLRRSARPRPARPPAAQSEVDTAEWTRRIPFKRRDSVTRILRIFSSSVPGQRPVSGAEPPGRQRPGRHGGTRPLALVHMADARTHPARRPRTFSTRLFGDADYIVHVTPDQDCEIIIRRPGTFPRRNLALPHPRGHLDRRRLAGGHHRLRFHTSAATLISGGLRDRHAEPQTCRRKLEDERNSPALLSRARRADRWRTGLTASATS